MTSHKVELLAPAGNYESFIGAINAGADAVYVGGEKFSARAYADNFSTESLCQCIKYAHLFGRRVYLTLNTLIKESEFSEICDYVKPFYLAGLDGVIIQDLGVLRLLKKHFPHMELHASTQMAVTGPRFVNLCKQLGISRVVPARELSLTELKEIKDAGIEVECFIHGAMCYCYSGMCLMSSILGGRSGNRGKCAQPCRLPYQVAVLGKKEKDTYTLSLKDMCTIEHVPALIQAGMDSFKIEGRMKRSEYAAGVTALYRKYIDLYYNNPEKPFRISKEDRYTLENLYMRSELHDGYLFKHNGKEMLTKDAPSYGSLDESILARIREKYIGYTKKLPVSVYGYFEVGQEGTLTVYTEDGISVTVNGQIVAAAENAPATIESVSKQLSKLGGTHFVLQDMDISIQGNAFLPNGTLNALRREALEQLEQEIIFRYFPNLQKRTAGDQCLATENLSEQTGASIVGNEEEPLKHALSKKMNKRVDRTNKELSILLQNKDQLKVLCDHNILHQVGTLYLEDKALGAYLTDKSGYTIPENIQMAYAMPYIVRSKDIPILSEQLKSVYDLGIYSVLVRSVESLSLVIQMKKEQKFDFSIITDPSLYCWNREAKEALLEYTKRITLPFELNAKELRPLRGEDTEQVIYGYIPLMVTANCILKTNDTCKIASGKDSSKVELKDRYGKAFAALTNCKYCYNILYNSVPLSLHKKYNQSWPGSYRLQFSIESPQETKGILDYYFKWIQGEISEFPIKEYTTAHENRQVE